MITLAMLLHDLPGVRLDGAADDVVQGVTCDSRTVTPGALFVALPGARVDGARFIDEALAKGAGAIAAPGSRPASIPASIPYIEIEGAPRAALALLSRRYFGAPDERLKLIGVTGTNGKTTTTHLLAAAYAGVGQLCGVGGTNGMRAGHYVAPGTLTTPEAPALWTFLAAAVDEGARAVAIEVSSAALVAGRAHAMQFAAAVLTGIGRDHLDTHGTVENYIAAKRMLFEMLGADAVAVIPADDPEAPSFRRATRARVVTFGETPDADWRLSDHAPLPGGATFRLTGPGFDDEVRTARPGAWDARNLAAAVACAAALGLDPALAVRGAAALPHVDGRWEPVDAGQPFAAIVDYAHTPEALERTLALLRQVTKGRVIVVFGAGGDRDPSKRPAMGRIAARYADLSLVTEDNPRGEDPEVIAASIADGLREANGAWERVRGRADAIRRAVSMAQAGDAVLVTGKGHETYQEIAGQREHFDDREQLRAALAERAAAGATGGRE